MEEVMEKKKRKEEERKRKEEKKVVAKKKEKNKREDKSKMLERRIKKEHRMHKAFHLTKDPNYEIRMPTKKTKTEPKSKEISFLDLSNISSVQRNKDEGFIEHSCEYQGKGSLSEEDVPLLRCSCLKELTRGSITRSNLHDLLFARMIINDRNAKYKASARKWHKILGAMFHIYRDNAEVDEWNMEEDEDYPSQPLGSLDCGLYRLKYMDYLARKDRSQNWDFNQANIVQYRGELAPKIIKKRLEQKVTVVIDKVRALL
ncbi:hypothetical protein COCNU_06G018760 [Cocos nucifera]|uniref:Ubiquitin-like protease family profile domain-containing protein n=1 Tax=Cocos nucifera TaxID=13894 RepID=A0A8K0IDV9_COCNU|nr:hypothetical protein COCNU_06G018760 [Cocos nucifera]